MSSRSRIRWIVGITAGVVLAVAIVGIVGFSITPYAKHRLTRLAKERFSSDLELSSIRVSLLPLTASVENLVFRHKGRRDVPPLIRIRRATAYMTFSSLLSLLTSTQSVRLVQLEGLVIHVARRKAPGEPEEKDKAGKEEDHSKQPGFMVQELVADGTVLRILPKDEWKEPMQYDLKTLHMESVGLTEPMRFVSELTNAKPPGLIHTKGYFGPFNKDDPGMTPVRGEYTFDNANLGDFKGIGGILSSKGRFSGLLARLVVDGYTDTPDFSVDVSGQPVHLKTVFHAIVDGTDGDTLLQPVKATFGQSRVVVNGGVYEIKGVKGKTVRLDVNVEDGRIEDMMRFAVKSKEPLLTGPIRYQAKMEIPPGKERVVTKLILDGNFIVADGRFTNPEVREKLGDLSNKAKGKPKEAPPAETASSFSGHFRLDDALLTLKNLSFEIPGADVHLNGTYHLLTEALDFKGKVALQAKVSQTTTGFKSWLLKMADPLFRGKKGAGAEVPITVKGKRSDPQFGVDAGEVLTP